MPQPWLTMAVAAACLAPCAALAHVILLEPAAPAGGTYHAAFIMHERCGESVSTGLRVLIPETVIAEQPHPKPGWTLSVVEEALAQPLLVDGRAMTRRLKEVAWQIETPRPATYSETFTVILHLPRTVGMLYLPAIQTCVTGERRWVEIPAVGQNAQDLRRPAPELRLEPAAAGAR